MQKLFWIECSSFERVAVKAFLVKFQTLLVWNIVSSCPAKVPCWKWFCFEVKADLPISKYFWGGQKAYDAVVPVCHPGSSLNWLILVWKVAVYLSVDFSTRALLYILSVQFLFETLPLRIISQIGAMNYFSSQPLLTHLENKQWWEIIVLAMAGSINLCKEHYWHFSKLSSLECLDWCDKETGERWLCVCGGVYCASETLSTPGDDLD